jgi:outer membrane protein OmpA-like peptidoglycan-associated protein/opacity protein-like surface antigen
MKRILIAAFAALAATFSTSAFAQGYAQPGYGWWNGFEVGIQGGYGWGTSSGKLLTPDTTSTGTFPHYNFGTSGGVGGVHLGYDWEMTPWVLGIEGDIEGGSVGGRERFPRLDVGVGTNMNFDSSIRGVAGWSFGQTLLYGTFGAAFGNVVDHYNEPIGVRIAGDSSTRVGWTAGAGLAYAFTPQWDANVEYRYTNLGQLGRIIDGGLANGGIETNNLFKYNMIRVGLTYRFAPPPPPPAPMPAAAPAPPPAPPPRVFLVFFDFDRYNLTPDARRVIEAAAQAYKATGSARLDVSGYTDLAGTQAYNLRLSRRRADAVAAYMVRLGVPRNVMDVKWFGKENPRVPTPDGVREPQNRRVEIEMH